MAIARRSVLIAAAGMAGLGAAYASKEAAAAYPRLAQVSSPTVRFDQFPIGLTDKVPINAGATNQHSIVRAPGDWIFAVFWGADLNPYVAKMNDGKPVWETFNLGTLPGNPLRAPAPADEHNNLAIMVDGAGYLHFSGNHHRVPLNYIRSAVPNEITGGWEAPGMVGSDETEVTYPAFVKLGNGNLLFFYRSGTSSDGDLMLNTYSTTTKRWTRVGMILKGHDWSGRVTEDMSAYPSRIALDELTGRIHIWWTWRDTTDLKSNHDLCYVYSNDRGETWRDGTGTAVTLPVTPADATVKVLTGGAGHVVSGACVDTAGNAYAAVRFPAPDSEVRIYKKTASTFSYTVLGPDALGHTALVETPDGQVYAVNNDAGYVCIRQVAPTLGTPVKVFPSAMPNWTPSTATMPNGSDIMRLLIAPCRKKTGSNYGGVLTMSVNPGTLADIASGKVRLPEPRPVASG